MARYVFDPNNDEKAGVDIVQRQIVGNRGALQVFGKNPNAAALMVKSSGDLINLKDASSVSKFSIAQDGTITGGILNLAMLNTTDMEVTDDLVVGDDVTVGGDITVTGTVTAADLAATDDLTVGDDLTVTGTATAGNIVTSGTAATGALTVTGTAGVSGAATVGSLITSGTAATGALTVTGAASASTTLTAGTGITATTGNITASSGGVTASGNITGANMVMAAGKGLVMDASGAAPKIGSVALVNGSATIATTSYVSGSYVFMTYGSAGTGTREPLRLGSFVQGTSFDIEGGGVGNNASVYWFIIN